MVFLKEIKEKDKKKDMRDKLIEKDFEEEFGKSSSISIIRDIVGFITYLLIALVIIPEILLRVDLKYLLPIYLPNVDMIATILSWWGGPYNVWKRLYMDDAEDYIAYISETIVNWLALIGMLYIVVDISRTEGMYVAWAYGLVMSLCSYLLPSRIIENVMDITYIETKMIQASVVSAFAIILLILFIERSLIYYLKDGLSVFGKKIIKLESVFNLFK